MPNITPYAFEGASVRTITIGAETHFVGKDVAQALGYADATTAIRSHCRGVQILHPIADSVGRMQDTRIITEADTLRLIVNSTLPAAERFERWVFEEVLPQIRKTGSYGAPEALNHAGNIAALEAAARMLNASESGKLMMLRSYANANAPALLPALPGYAVDAPVIAGANAVSSEVTMSATALLQEHQAGMSAKRFNKLAKSAGLLTEVARQTSKGGTKLFSVVTEAGLAFGKNLVSPQSPRETQPHWYVSTFDDLLHVVSAAA